MEWFLAYARVTRPRKVSDKYRSSAEAASEQLRLMKEAQLLQDQLKRSSARCGAMGSTACSSAAHDCVAAMMRRSCVAGRELNGVELVDTDRVFASCNDSVSGMPRLIPWF